MTNRKFNNIFLLVIFGLYVGYYKLVLSYSQSNIVEYINATSIVILAFITILLFGFRKDKLTPLKKSIIKMTITEILIFLGVSYGLGTITGFLKNSYALTIPAIISNMIVPLIYIIAIEICRYSFIQSNRDKKIPIYLFTALVIILELTMGLTGVLMYNFETTFKAVSSIVLPIILRNVSLSYISLNGGIKPVLIYRLIIELYTFVVPIVPDLGEYLTSIIGILLPTFIYMYAARMVDENAQEKEAEFTKKTFKFSDIPIIIFIIILGGLISNKFSYSLIGVGSESMHPKIDKGDAVVFKRVKSEKDFKIGDVIVFDNGSKMIIHRLVEIKKDGNTNYYITKGDNNNSKDNLNLTIDKIQGKVLFKIKYLAYPNLWLKEIIGKE